MANSNKGNKLTIRLTDDQQTQIRNVTGKSVAELNIGLGAMGQLTAEDLDQVSGGSGGKLSHLAS
jgi:hypothetical protein